MLSIIEKSVSFVKIHMKGFLITSDLFGVCIAFLFATYLKFDAPRFFPEWFNNNAIYIILVDVVVTSICFFVSKIYNRMWQYFISRDYAVLLVSFIVSKIIAIIPFVYIWYEYTRSFLTFMSFMV